MITIEPLLLRDQIAEGPAPSANFLLLKLLPTADQNVAGMPLNLAIVIDNSTSMHIWRQPIREAIEAACQAVDLLGPDDSISVVAFQDEARVFQPSAPVRDKERIKQAIRSIQDWASGGTRIAAGVQAALGQIRAGARQNRASRLLLLTDGHAEDATACLGLAREASGHGVVFTTMGLGDQWNQHLLAEMAAIARGHWQYVRQASELGGLFRKEMSAAKETYVSDVIVRLTLRQGVAVNMLRQVEPDVTDIATEILGEREILIRLFTMQKRAPVYLLAELHLSPRVAGRYLLAEVSASYLLHGSERRQTDIVRIELQVAPGGEADHAWQNGTVLRYIDLEHIERDYRQAAAMVEQGAAEPAGQLLMRAHAAAHRIGDQKRAGLIHQTLTELERTGQLSAGTRLTGLDALRVTNLLMAKTEEGGRHADAKQESRP